MMTIYSGHEQPISVTVHILAVLLVLFCPLEEFSASTVVVYIVYWLLFSFSLQ